MLSNERRYACGQGRTTGQIICLLLFLRNSMSASFTPTNIVTGATFTDITPQLIPYTSSTPLFYKISYHTNITRSIPKRQLQTTMCNNQPPLFPHLCNKQNTLTIVQQYIHDMLLINKRIYEPQRNFNNVYFQHQPKRALDFLGDGLEWCCNVATMTNLKDLSQNELQVDKKLNNLLDYVKAEHGHFASTQTKLQNFSRSINDILTKLHNDMKHSEDIQTSNLRNLQFYLESQLLTNIEETWLYIYLTLYYNHLHQAELDCQDNRIPAALISQETLTTDLNQLQNKLKIQNLTLALQLSNTKYLYTLPIAKCHYDHQNILVQIQIPIKSLQTPHKTYLYRAVPFQWDNKICNLPSEKLIIFKTKSTTYIVDTDNNNECNYQKTGLCLIPRQAPTSTPASKCINFLLTNTDISLLRKHCEFHCSNTPNYTIIQPLNINTFIITNMQDRMQVHCASSSTSISIPYITRGAIELQLPCDCYLQEGNTTLINSIIPCDTRDYRTPTVYHLIPQPWTNLDNMDIDPLDEERRTHFYNVTEFVLPNWHLQTPTFTVNRKEPLQLFNHITPKNTWIDILDDRRLLIHILLVWAALITLILLIAFYNLHIMSIKLKTYTPALPPRDH